MSLELNSPCKVNLLLNVLGRRADGFHDIETLLHPVALCDRLQFEKGGSGMQLSCTEASLPVDDSNLVHRAAVAFLEAVGISDGVRIHLEKRLPMAAGLGGGSANAAVTLLGLNRLFDQPASLERLTEIAAGLGSDIPFFLQNGPAIGTGRGERIQPIEPFDSLKDAAILLVRPGFGVPTPWAYQSLAVHPAALNGTAGKAAILAGQLRVGGLEMAREGCSNSLEAPVFGKYPILAILKDYLLEQGAAVALLSGSGSTTFALMDSVASAETLRDRVPARFGRNLWTAVAPL